MSGNTAQNGRAKCNLLGPEGNEGLISRVFSKVSQKKLKIQLKLILNWTRAHCDYVFIT